MKHYFLLFLILLSYSYTYAGGISIEPLRIELNAKPGHQLEGFYTVTNTDTQPLRVAIQSKDYFTLEENKRFGIENWFRLFLREFDLGGRDSQKIMYNITVPQKAQGFLMVLNSFSSEKLTSQGDVQKEMLKTAYSVPVYVRIKGRETVSAEIQKLEIAGDTNTVHVMVQVHNSGNTYLRPSGKVEIFEGKKPLGSINLKKGWPVFPNKTELYQGQQTGFDLKPGNYTMIAKMWNESPVVQFDKEEHFKVNKQGVIENQ